MARIVVSSAAFLGDVAPFVEPANRLVDQGHDVVFLTPPGFHDVLADERFELASYPLDFSPKGMRADRENERLMRHPWLNQVRLGRYWMRRGFVEDPVAASASVLDVLEDADLLITHPTFGSHTVPAALHLDVPVVVGQLFPMLMPTAAWSPPLPDRNFDLGARLNRLAWRGFARGSGVVMYDRRLNQFRQRLGLDKIRSAAMLSWTEAQKTVVMVSRHYFGDAPDDWGDWPLVGFSAWPGPRGMPTDERVDEFLDAGDPPVLVCLGTAAAAGAGEAFNEIAAGLKAHRLRSLLLVADSTNLAQLDRLHHLDHSDDSTGAFEFVSIPEVAGRCVSAVVSGALGTLAAALTAGIPVVVVPQLFDQVWHGRRVESLGVGIMVTNSSKVAAAIAELHRDPSYADRARELGAKLRAEDGASALVDAATSALQDARST